MKDVDSNSTGSTMSIAIAKKFFRPLFKKNDKVYITWDGITLIGWWKKKRSETTSWVYLPGGATIIGNKFLSKYKPT